MNHLDHMDPAGNDMKLRNSSVSCYCCSRETEFKKDLQEPRWEEGEALGVAVVGEAGLAFSSFHFTLFALDATPWRTNNTHILKKNKKQKGRKNKQKKHVTETVPPPPPKHFLKCVLVMSLRINLQNMPFIWRQGNHTWMLSAIL